MGGLITPNPLRPRRRHHVLLLAAAQSLSCSDSLGSQGLQPTRLLCPWNFPGMNTGLSCRFLLQGIFLTQELNLCLFHLLHWQADSLPLHHRACVLSRSVTLQPYLARLLCPRDSPGKNPGVGCLAFLQSIFPTQGLNPLSKSPALAGGFFITGATW